MTGQLPATGDSHPLSLFDKEKPMIVVPTKQMQSHRVTDCGSIAFSKLITDATYPYDFGTSTRNLAGRHSQGCEKS